MKSKRFGHITLGGLTTLAVLGFASAAQAEMVSYDFTANIVYVSGNGEAAAAGLPISGNITGSFTYDSEKGWGTGSNAYVDNSLALVVDGTSLTATSTELMAQGSGNFIIQETTGQFVGVQLTLPDQNLSWSATTLPTSLSFTDGGYLKFFVGESGSFNDIDLAAQITSLVVSGKETVSGAVSTPELDPASGSAALVLLLGGAALMGGARRRRELASV